MPLAFVVNEATLVHQLNALVLDRDGMLVLVSSRDIKVGEEVCAPTVAI